MAFAKLPRPSNVDIRTSTIENCNTIGQSLMFRKVQVLQLHNPKMSVLVT